MIGIVTIIITIECMCLCGGMAEGGRGCMYVEVREELARIGSLHCRFPGWNAGCQAWLQTLVTLEPYLHILSVENVTILQNLWPL